MVIAVLCVTNRYLLVRRNVAERDDDVGVGAGDCSETDIAARESDTELVVGADRLA